MINAKHVAVSTIIAIVTYSLKTNSIPVNHIDIYDSTDQKYVIVKIESGTNNCISEIKISKRDFNALANDESQIDKLINSIADDHLKNCKESVNGVH